MGFKKESAYLELIISLVAVGIILLCTLFWNMYGCSNYGSLTERTTKYSIVSGCYVKTPSGWIPQDEMSKRAYGNSVVKTIQDE